MAALLAHCDLPADAGFRASAAGRFHAPTYYRPRFSPSDLAIIADETAETARLFGYEVSAAEAPRRRA